VRLLAIQILSKQRGWSEVKRMQMEKEWVGEVKDVRAEVSFGWEVVKLPAGGHEVRRIMVSGWMIPVFEARRATNREKSTKYEAELTSLRCDCTSAHYLRGWPPRSSIGSWTGGI